MSEKITRGEALKKILMYIVGFSLFAFFAKRVFAEDVAFIGKDTSTGVNVEFISYDDATGLLTIGKAGDIILGDSTVRDMYAQTDGCINLGKAGNAFNNAHIKGTLNINNGAVVAGTYTPTLTNVTNVAASTAYQAQYIRVGNVVNVSGKVDIDATLAASTATELGISLPVSSNLGTEQDLGGVAISDVIASLSARIKADATNDRASVVFKSLSLTNDSYAFIFTYEII